MNLGFGLGLGPLFLAIEPSILYLIAGFSAICADNILELVCDAGIVLKLDCNVDKFCELGLISGYSMLLIRLTAVSLR